MELYTNARFISCEKENRIYTAMAVKGGHIVWLGDESSIPPRYAKAKRVDLGGATVTPAFGDTHMHFGSLCVFENTFYLMDVKNFAEAKAAVRRYADSHRKNKVLMGYGCTANTVAEHRLPEKRDLDDWTERPLMVMKYDGHAAVCNSAMLALLSDKVKSDPGCNTETGWLYQSAFYNGVNEATAYIPTMDIIRGLSGGAEYLASVGIGLVHTVEGVGFANDLDIDMIKILAPGLPQAFRIITPPLTNELVLLTKDSSLVYVLGLMAPAFELTKFGRTLMNSTGNLTPLVVAGFSYLIITLPLTFLVRRMEDRQKKAR